MATITDCKLSLAHDPTKKTVRAVATCKVNFTTYEQNEMRKGLQFKLQCKLRGADSGLTGKDDHLYTYTPPKYFPDASPTASEAVTFEETLGEGVLDEDWGVDEVYARFFLTNLYTLVQVSKNSNTVSHSF